MGTGFDLGELPKRMYRKRKGWFGDSLRHSLARRRRRAPKGMRVNSSTGSRWVKFDRRNNKFKGNIPYNKHLRGLKLQRINRISEAQKRLTRNVIGNALPIAGKVMGGTEIAQDTITILNKGKRKPLI